MAVGAANLAFLDLQLDRCPRESRRDHVPDVVELVSEMIELEHYRVSFAAVDTGVLRQVAPRARPIVRRRLVAHDSHVVLMLVAIPRVPAQLVVGVASATTPLPNVPGLVLEGKVIDRLHVATPG